LSGYDGKEGRPDFNIIAPDPDDEEDRFQEVPFIGVFDGNRHIFDEILHASFNSSLRGGGRFPF